jgi:nucleoside-diphosphate-sugar epimerase
VGEAFNAVSPAALNLKGYASHMFRFFGHIPRISFMPYEMWRQGRDPAEAEATWEHIVRSPCHAIDKARTRLGYQPRYSSLEAVEEAVRWLIAAGEIDPGPAFAAK